MEGKVYSLKRANPCFGKFHNTFVTICFLAQNTNYCIPSAAIFRWLFLYLEEKNYHCNLGHICLDSFRQIARISQKTGTDTIRDVSEASSCALHRYPHLFFKSSFKSLSLFLVAEYGIVRVRTHPGNKVDYHPTNPHPPYAP